MSALGVVLLVWQVGGGLLLDAKIFVTAPGGQTLAECEAYAEEHYPPAKYWHVCTMARSNVPVVRW